MGTEPLGSPGIFYLSPHECASIWKSASILPKARTNSSRPLTMNANAGGGYIRPFNSVVSL